MTDKTSPEYLAYKGEESLADRYNLKNRNDELHTTLDKTAYALFEIKRMGVSDEVAEHVEKYHSLACRVLDNE